MSSAERTVRMGASTGTRMTEKMMEDSGAIIMTLIIIPTSGTAVSILRTKKERRKVMGWFVILLVFAYAVGQGFTSGALELENAEKTRKIAWFSADVMLCLGVCGLACALFAVLHYEHSETLDFWDYGEMTAQGKWFVVILLACCVNAVAGFIAVVRLGAREIGDKIGSRLNNGEQHD